MSSFMISGDTRRRDWKKYFKRKGMAAWRNSIRTAALRSYLNCFVVIFEYECPAVQLPLVPSSSSRPLGHAEIESHKKSLLLVAISTWIAEISYFISGLDRDLGIFPWFNTNGTIILHCIFLYHIYNYGAISCTDGLQHGSIYSYQSSDACLNP